MHLDGPATPIWDSPNRDAVLVRALRITTQRVLTDPAAWQMNVQMGAGMPGGQRGAVRRGECQGDHILVARDNPPVDDFDGQV